MREHSIRRCRVFDFRFTRYPPLPATFALAAAIYINFFTHHFAPDLRVPLFALTALLFARTFVIFTPWRHPRRMPLMIGWLLVATFMWAAENIATFARAWVYPDQAAGWAMVSPAKLGAWVSPPHHLVRARQPRPPPRTRGWAGGAARATSRARWRYE